MSWASCPGHFFALFGLGNLACYGLSLVSDSANFDYYFGYRADGRFFQPFRSMLASEKFLNVALTAPALIAGGTYLQSKIGVMRSTKFFALSVLSSYLFTVSFAPTTLFADLNLRKYWHMVIPDIGCYND